MSIAPTFRAARAYTKAGIIPLFWGAPGRGKTSYAKMQAEMDDVPYWEVVGSRTEPSDWGGIPWVNPQSGESQSVPPPWFVQAQKAGRGVIIIDELGNTPPSIQAGMLGFALDRHIAEHALPDGIVIMAATNNEQDGTDSQGLAPPTANRFGHLDFEYSARERLSGRRIGWENLYKSLDINVVENPDRERFAAAKAVVSAFLESNPRLIEVLPDDLEDLKGWPSDRTWSMVERTLAYMKPEDTDGITVAVTGLVGEAAAIEFMQFYKFADLPKPADLIADPSILNWKAERLEVVYLATIGAITYVASAMSDSDLSAKAKTVLWQKTWGVLKAAAEAAKGDIATASVTDLMACRPSGAKVPQDAIKAFSQIVRLSGIGLDNAA